MQQDLIVGGQYRLVSQIGAGAFGKVWLALNEKTKEKVAIKFEPQAEEANQLYYECKIYLWLHSQQTVIAQGIPQIYFFGKLKLPNLKSNKMEEWHIIVMELLGTSLEDLFELCGRRNKKRGKLYHFSLKTVLMIAHQMFHRIEYLHSRRVIHRDIKPDNFSMGKENRRDKIYLIDYGLAKKYMSGKGRHIAFRDNKSLIGTARYA